jgi:PAS domain S-box-containing protein
MTESADVQQENLLQEKDNFFYLITENVPALIAYVDAEDLRYRFVNSHYEDFFKKPRETIIGRQVREIIGEKNYKFALPYIEEVLSGKAASYENMFITSQGESWMKVNYAPDVDKSGAVKGIFVLNVDITEGKLAEKALQESEQKFKDLSEKSVAGVYLVQDGIFKYVNSKLARTLGYEIEEMTDKVAVKDIIFPEDWPLVEENVRKRMSGELGSIHYEFRVTTKNKEVRNIEVYSSRTLYRGKPAIIGTQLDITERKQAEEELRKSERRLRQVIDLVPHFIFAKDRAGRFILVNKAMADAYGVTVEELTGKTDGDFNPNKDEVDHFMKDDLLVMDSGQPKEIPEEYITDSKRSIRILQTIKIPFAVSLRGDDAILGVSTDITERKKMEEEKVRLESELRQAQKMEAIGTLAGGVAHDFNNILTAINGFGTLLQMGIEESSPLRRYVNQILLSSQKAANLTRSLLTFSRKQPVTLIPISINNCIKGTEKLLKRLLTEDIELSTSFAPEDVIIMADTTQIDQILFNLATNARDAMKKGGKINIEIKPFDMDKQFKKLHGFGFPGKYALLTVTDTGHGMDESTKEKMFDPFFTTKELGKGTGLGLSTVYGIVKQHNGYIDVSSKPGLGTTFSVYLPAIEIVAEEEKIFSHTIKGGYETILVAEDDTDVRLFMKETLSNHGYTVIEATDGQNAIDKFKEHMNFDLVILDSVMPRKNGRETYDDIRIVKPFIKVLFMSGYTSDIIIDKGVEEGKVDFIAKPFSQDELIKKVRDVLDK